MIFFDLLGGRGFFRQYKLSIECNICFNQLIYVRLNVVSSIFCVLILAAYGLMQLLARATLILESFSLLESFSRFYQVFFQIFNKLLVDICMNN